MRKQWILVLAAASLYSGASLAHHSPIVFDRTRELTIVGVVTEFKWSSPHAWIHLDVADAVNAQDGLFSVTSLSAAAAATRVVGSLACALHLPTPAVDERYAPLLDILPLQRLALALALARGEDPDAPRGLKKITSTL